RGGLDVYSDSGARVKDGIAVLQQSGAVAEDVWPYRAGEFAKQPPAPVARAQHYRISRGIRLKGIHQIKSALQLFGPVVLGLTLLRAEIAVRCVGKLALSADDTGRDSLLLAGTLYC